jgi:outer membrane protein assembly factor BamB
LGKPLVVFGSTNPDDAVYALDARDGLLAWRFQTAVTALDEDVGAAPTISAPGVNGITDGAVYVDGKDRIEYALNLRTGEQLWSFDLGRDAGAQTNCQSAAALLGRQLVVPYNAYVYKLDAVTGKRVWRTAAAPATFLSSPAISGGAGDRVVFSGDLAGVEHGYRLVDGAEVSAFSTAGAVLSSVAISSGTVYFGGTDHYVYALS